MYQQYGCDASYGFETMDILRQLLLELSLNVEEWFEDSLFRYSLGGADLCLVNWHRTGVQVFIYSGSDADGGSDPVLVEYKVGEEVDWAFIKEKLRKLTIT